MNAPANPAPERIPQLREKLFKAMSSIEACRMGSDSMLAPLCGSEDPDFGDALAVSYELVNEVADKLASLIPSGARAQP